MTNTTYKRHPIQLQSLQVIELSLRVLDQVAIDRTDDFTPDGFAIETGHSPYDQDEKSITVRMRVVVGDDEPTVQAEDDLCEDIPQDSCVENPLYIHVEVQGLFSVEPERFPVEHIEDWAAKNAPLILYPYVREHVFALSARANIKPLLLPLFEVPTYKVTKQDSK